MIITLGVWTNYRDLISVEGEISALSGDTIFIVIETNNSEKPDNYAGDIGFTWKIAEDYHLSQKIKIWTKGPATGSYPSTVKVTKIKKLE